MASGAERPIIPVLLCGGSGTRLWPLSRKSYPKQFAPIIADESLFQASARRFAGPGFGPPIVVTANPFRFIVRRQLEDVGLVPGAILIEPEGRDTGPAVLAAALHAQQHDPDATLLVAPADHVIPDTAALTATIAAARPTADAGQLVTFGVWPDRADTGYGYLELAENPGSEPYSGPQPIRRFVEKPAPAAAEAMAANPRFLWNAGLFLMTARACIHAYEIHAQTMHGAVHRACAATRKDLDFIRLDPASWQDAPALSIDYAVMEKADNIAVAPYTGRWSDLGDWQSVWRETEEDGVALSGVATARDCHNTLLRAEHPEQAIVGIGLRDIIAVAMPDAVLVAHVDRAQEVKQAVTELRRAAVPQADTFPRDHRPWGWFESLASGPRFQVKRIVVEPGAALSLQAHHHRAEHWIVVEGTARVTVEETIRLVSENQSIYVPLGARHRLENPGKLPIVLIEVQTGSYLGEDDITRFDDIYARD